MSKSHSSINTNSTQKERAGNKDSLLQSLRQEGFGELFKDSETLLLQDALIKGVRPIRELLGRLLKAGFRMVVYFEDGSRFALQGVRENRGGFLQLNLLKTKTEAKRLILQAEELKFCTIQHPEQSFFVLSTSASFPLEKDIELIKLAVSSWEGEEEQPDPAPGNYGDKKQYGKTGEEEKTFSILHQFMDRFSNPTGSKLYLFFRQAPFHFLEEDVRNEALAKGEEGLKALLHRQE